MESSKKKSTATACPLPSSGEPLDFIQSLRGVAALLVVFWHASRYFGEYGSGIAGLLFAPGGTLGVDLFFMISGFIMVYITSEAKITPQYSFFFLVRRLLRIVPVYILFTLLRVFVLMIFSIDIGNEFGMHLLYSFTFIPNAIDQAPAYGRPVLGVGWTLNYEMYFYLVFGLSLLFGKWQWLALSIWFSATLLIPGYYFSQEGELINLSPYMIYPLGLPYLQMITSPIIWFFVFGMICAYAYRRVRLKKQVLSRILLLLASIAVTMQYAASFRTGHGIVDWGISLIPFFFVISLVKDRFSFFSSKVMVFLGNISYSLYLVHPIVQISYDHLIDRYVNIGFLKMGLAPFIITTMLSIFAAYISYFFVEKTLGRKIRKLTKSSD